MLHSNRLDLDYPDPASELETADVPRDIAAVVAVLERMTLFGQGAYSALPVSTSGSPGKQGRWYYANDGGTTGGLWYDYGTGWIGPLGAVSTAMVEDIAISTVLVFS